MRSVLADSDTEEVLTDQKYYLRWTFIIVSGIKSCKSWVRSGADPDEEQETVCNIIVMEMACGCLIQSGIVNRIIQLFKN